MIKILNCCTFIYGAALVTIPF